VAGAESASKNRHAGYGNRTETGFSLRREVQEFRALAPEGLGGSAAEQGAVRFRQGQAFSGSLQILRSKGET
jgi:hypothetical protein